MIKASELRLGITLNIFNVGFNPVTIDEKRLIALIKGEEKTYYPIQITTEILKKMGYSHHSTEDKYGIRTEKWNRIGDRFGHLEIWSSGEVESYKIYVGDHRYVTLKYVHQLQNVYFALTGVDLELKSPYHETHR